MEEKLHMWRLQGERCIVEMQWETDWSTTSSFKDVFMSIAQEKSTGISGKNLIWGQATD